MPDEPKIVNIDADPINANWIRLLDRQRRLKDGEVVEDNPYLDQMLRQGGMDVSVESEFGQAKDPHEKPAAPS